MIIKNAAVYCADFLPVETDIETENEKIKSIGKTDKDGIDFSGCCVLPGFIDIHIPLTEDEYIGWSHTSYLNNLIEKYDEEKDIEFYGDAAQNIFRVCRHQAAVFFPEDAHAPNIGVGIHHKLCIKIPVEP